MVLRAAAVTLLSFFLLSAQTAPTSSQSDKDSAQANPAAATPEAPPILSCVAGASLGALELRVKAPNGDEPLPFENINHLSEGDTLLYAPILEGKEKRPGEIALILVPARRESDKSPMVIVTEPKSAERPQQWKIDETVSLAAFVYGPQGLSRKKVQSFIAQDNLLIAQLADYAEKTAQTEALVSALSNAESSSASVNAALTGFASQYGFAVQLDKNAPPAVQAETLFATMNPQLATYNPLASSTAERAGQTASLATAFATLFFGSPIGLAAGGTAMLLDLRAIAFPDTQFRSSFAEALPKSPTNTDAGINLCGQRGPAPPHTRVAYIWASRIPNTPTPQIQIGDANYIPEHQKSPVPVDVPEIEWKYLQRARKWSLENAGKQKTDITVLKLGNQKALEIDLSKAALSPGVYHLDGFWDWTPFAAKGVLNVLPLSNFTQAKLEPASQDRLLANCGKVAVTLAGSDFEFTTKVEMKKVGDEFATAEPVRFLLPKGLRRGPQDHMDVLIDTAGLQPGPYELLITQQDDKTHPVNFRILPNPPQIENLPIIANQGVAVQHYVLKGQRLDELAKLEVKGAAVELGAASTNGDERNITVQIESNPKPGTLLPIEAYVQDRNEPLTFDNGLQITGPLPVIASSKLSLPANMQIAVHGNEFPAGATLTALLDVKNIERRSVLRLGCADGVGPQTALHIGEQTRTSNLQQLSQDQLFLSFDTAALPAGCMIEARLDNGRGGVSEPFSLARIILLPHIDVFTVSDQATAPGAHTYVLTGENLEMIEKLGWDQSKGVSVTNLPAPVPGQVQQQTLTVTLPDPTAPQPALYVWLRGDASGRATTIQVPPVPKATASAPPTSKPVQPQSTPATPAATPPPSNPPLSNPEKEESRSQGTEHSELIYSSVYFDR